MKRIFEIARANFEKILFIHFYPHKKHMDGARDTFWIKSLNGTFLALQIKASGSVHVLIYVDKSG